MVEFIIKSEKLEKLKDKFEDARAFIEKTINEKRPIWIRHHNDCDGYSGAIILEKAILKQLYEFHARESDVFYYYKRMPSRTPFYDQMDASRDIAMMLGEMNRFNRKAPLLIIVDNGSSEEDILALKKLKAYDVNVIVIDHHPFAQENEGLIDIHINSMHAGDGEICAGMLCAELSRMIYKDVEMPEVFAALAGIGDKSSNDEHRQYIGLAEKLGFERERLKKIASLIDFEADNIAFMEARYFVQDLMFGNKKVQEQFIKIADDEITKFKDKVRGALKHAIDIEDAGGFVIGMVDADAALHRSFRSYSMAAGMGLEIVETAKGKNAVMLGHGNDIVTFRISKALDIDMNDIKKKLISKYPYALITGGGHARAGTIHFSSRYKDDIMAAIKQYLMPKNGER